MTSTARGSSTGIGELALIDAIGAALDRRPGSRVVRWLGDDAAVVRAGAFAVTSVDAMVEGTHFTLGPRCGPEDVGHRALAGALSDLAAMGAAPGEAYLCVVLPPGLDDTDVLALHRGAEALAAATRDDDRRRRPRARAGADGRRDRGRLGRPRGGARGPRRRAPRRPRRRDRDARRLGGRPRGARGPRGGRRRARAAPPAPAAAAGGGARARARRRDRDARPLRRAGVGRPPPRRGRRR